MFKGILRIETAKNADAELLAEIRVDSMRPSLQAVGRFDPERARSRFLSSFQAPDTNIIYLEEKVAGFFVVRTETDHLYLDHLYVVATFQGRGIGRRIVHDLKAVATTASLVIRLMALNESPSNRFYKSCGFKFVSADQLDTLYQWSPA